MSLKKLGQFFDLRFFADKDLKVTGSRPWKNEGGDVLGTKIEVVLSEMTPSIFLQRMRMFRTSTRSWTSRCLRKI